MTPIGFAARPFEPEADEVRLWAQAQEEEEIAKPDAAAARRIKEYLIELAP